MSGQDYTSQDIGVFAKHEIDLDEKFLRINASNCLPQDFASIAKLKHLENLEIDYKGLGDTGLGILRELPNLRKLKLYMADDITERGLAALQYFPALESLTIVKTAITDEELVEIGKISKLTTLQLGDNHSGSTSKGQIHFSHLKNLKTLRTWGIAVDSACIEELAHLPHLRNVTLNRRVTLTPPGIKALEELTQLSHLDLSENPIDSTVFPSIAKLTQLKSLSLRDTNITNINVIKVMDLKNLEHLDLARTKIDDEVMPYIGNLPNLKHLDLSRTRITDRYMGYLKKLKNLQELALAHTGITSKAIQHLTPENHAGLHSIDITNTKVNDDGLQALSRLPNLLEANRFDLRETTEPARHNLDNSCRKNLERISKEVEAAELGAAERPTPTMQVAQVIGPASREYQFTPHVRQVIDSATSDRNNQSRS